MTAAPLTVAEELLLLAHDPARGRPLANARYLRWGPAGAALAELAEAGRIAGERGNRITVVNPLPPGDPVPDGAPAALPVPAKQRRGVAAERWVQRSGRPVQELCLRRLVERGALRREPRRAPGLFRYERFPAGAVDLLGPARERFVAAAAAGFPDRRGRLLGALVSAAGLDRTVLPGRDHRTARRAMKHFAQEIWTAQAVGRAVRADKSAADGS
ncbi:GOLPH3/VPS74 family protein [Streptomyces kronopolitis]|uniref:GOLPH3/VPS74 family protein n=1 Tax=Streptomyces kronopolitis TaxID=1612435 RepID=UPI003D97B05F